jgi:hypothetical protein
MTLSEARNAEPLNFDACDVSVSVGMVPATCTVAITAMRAMLWGMLQREARDRH